MKFTAIYMSEAGNIEQKEFDSLEDSRAFFRELATKDIPIKHFEDSKLTRQKKTRLDEVEAMLETATLSLSSELNLLTTDKLKTFNKIIELHKKIVKLEIEKNKLEI